MLRYLGIALICCFPQLTHATGYDEMNQYIQDFEQSGLTRFAPTSMKRVKAYQGASMLAYEEQGGFNDTLTQSDQLKKAIEKTMQALDEAKNNAASFQSIFPDLIALEKEARKALLYHHKPNTLAEPQVQTLFERAQTQMNLTIKSSEQGQLNLARQAAQKARTLFYQSIDKAMPKLVEQTERALSRARSVDADDYAPQTYDKAEQAFEALEAYAKDIQQLPEKRKGIKRPKRIGYALEMAVYAQKIAIKVKGWRRNKGSYEELYLNNKHERLKLAKIMRIPLDYDNVEVDITADDLFKHIQQLQHTLEQERQQHALQIAELNEKYQVMLEQKLHQQRLQDQKAFQEKIANVKAALNSKLARETFEKQRQQQVRDLFQSSEAEIITNLDGSLLIRAKAIQFEPNSSKVDSAYFDFLGRIKDALDLYPSRTIIIEGHTDSTGDAMQNRKLSLARAEAVQEFLIAAGMDASRIKAVGYGEAKPIATNMYKKGRAMNRRIDIVIQAPR